MKLQGLKNDIFAILEFTKRNILAFFRERATVFFSILSPLIVLMLYVFFLGDVQVESIKSAIPQGLAVEEKLIKAFVDSWLISGIMCVSCMTVALNSMLVMVSDKENKLFRDFTSAPVKPSTLTLGYFISFYVITFLICFGVLVVGIIYLAACGSLYITAKDFFTAFGILLLSVTSSTLILMTIMSFMKSGSASGAFSGIFSAISGFIVGAYMPVSMFPDAIASLTVIVPGTSTGGLFRNYLMRGALEKMSENLPEAFSNGIKSEFGFDMEFFGKTLGTDFMWIYLAAGIVVFLAVNIILGIVRKRKAIN